MRNLIKSYSLAFSVALAVGLFAATEADAVSDKYRKLSARLVVDAEQEMLQDRAAEADRLLNLALTADPGNARAYVLKGEAQRKLDNKDEGLRLIGVGLEIEPGDTRALRLQGEAALDVGDVEQAEKSLNRLRTVCAAPCEAANSLAEAIEQNRAGAEE